MENPYVDSKKIAICLFTFLTVIDLNDYTKLGDDHRFTVHLPKQIYWHVLEGISRMFEVQLNRRISIYIKRLFVRCYGKS